MQRNLTKAQNCWSRISSVLCGEHVLSHVYAVQAILLSRSESWNITLSALKCLEGFHIRVARRMTGMMPKTNASTGAWVYLALADVLESDGLQSIDEYIQVRQQTITSCIVTRPMFDLCREGGWGAIATTNFGGSNRLTWRKQELWCQLGPM